MKKFIVFIITAIILAVSTSFTAKSQSVEIGKTYTITANIYVGSTKDNLKEVYSYAMNGNTTGVLTMGLYGKATILSYGAKVSVIDFSGTMVKLRIVHDGVNGEANGYTVYAYLSDLRKKSRK